MNVYLESSAALRDILNADGAAAIRGALAGADLVTTSRLTLTEVGRTLCRLRHAKQSADFVVAQEAAFFRECELWAIEPVSDDIMQRCGRSFPVEPVRCLDGIHLATIDKVSLSVPDLVVLSTDDRVRDNAKALGFRVAP